MDPVTWALIGTAATAAATAVTAVGQHQTANAQADADQQRQEIEGQWAKRRADEQRTAGQHAATQEKRNAEFAQSRLTALAGAGGGSASDPGIMELWGDIAKEGDYNAAMAQGGAEQKATGTEYQADLDAWTTDANGRIKRQGGNTSLIAGLLSAGGQMGGGMAEAVWGRAIADDRNRLWQLDNNGAAGLMAKLPSAIDLQRRPAPEQTPDVRVKAVDYSPLGSGKGGSAAALGNAIGGANGLAGFAATMAEVGQQRETFDVERRLVDFKLDSELAYEAQKRQMQPGGTGHRDTWGEQYADMAKTFVGDNDARIPPRLRAQIGTALQKQDVALSERAQRDEWAEADRQTKDSLEVTLGRTRSVVEADPNRLEAAHGDGLRLIEAAPMQPAMKHALARKYRLDLEEAAASSVADGVRDAESYARAKEILAPHRAERVTARGVKGAILGEVSAKYESGGRGVGFVSSGKGDPGGASYGVHQLSTKDSMPAFIRSDEGSPYAESFRGLQPGTQAFNAAYRQAAAADPDGFAQAQKAFYTRTHYEPVLEHARGRGLAVDDRGVQEALFSIGVQHGGAKKIVDRAMGAAGDDPAGQIRALYASRTEYVRGLDTLPGDTKASVLGRYRREERDALALVGTSGEVGADQGGAQADAYDGPYQSLSLAKRRAIWGRAEGQFDKVKKGVEATVKEQMSVAASGYLPPEPILNELDRQVRAIGDPMLAAQYDSMLRNAQLTQQLQKAPPLAIEEQARRLRDAAAQGGATKEIAAQISHVEKVAESVRKNVNDDPMGWAQRTGIAVALGNPDAAPGSFRAAQEIGMGQVTLEQIDFRSPDVGRTLAYRAEQAKQVGDYYGQPPKIFTKNEREFLKDTLQKGGKGMLSVLGSVAKAAADAGIEPAEVMKEFSKDAPEVAVIGEAVVAGADPRVLETAASALSWRAKQGEKFVSTIDKAQVKPDLAEYADVLAATPTKADAVRHTANLVYEYEARRQGKEQFDPELYRTTVRRLMGETEMPDGSKFGGVGEQGTGWRDGKWRSGGWFGTTPKVLVPPEIKQDSFDDMVGALRMQDLTGRPPVDADGKQLTMGQVRSAAWISVGPGRYALELKRDSDGTRAVAYSQGGQPYVLDVRPLMPAIQRRKPEIFRGYDGVARGVNE